jgi:PilZ domain
MLDHAPRTERRYIRYGCDQRLCIRYRTDAHDFIAYGRCTVVGKGGIGSVLPAVELEIGQVVSVEISLSTPAAPSALKAQVKNRHGFSYGFQFLESDGRAAAMLGPLFRPEAVQVFPARA